jgi:hypothetical protein
MAAASFEVVSLLSTNALLPRTCVRCGAEKPTKHYDTKAKALLGTQYVLGGRRETWATYSLKPWLCESCHRRLFRTTNLLMIAGGVLEAVGMLVVLGLALGPWSGSSDLSIDLLALVLAPVIAGLLLLLSGVFLRPPMPLAVETKMGSVRLVFENQAVAGAFVAANQGSCGDVFTRVIRPREWALYAILGSILGLIVLEAVQMPSWIQQVLNPKVLPMILVLFGSMIASGLIAASVAMVFSRKASSVVQAKRLALFGGLFSIGWLLFLDLAINSSRTFSLNPLAVLLGIAGVAAVYFSFETSEGLARPPPPPTA